MMRLIYIVILLSALVFSSCRDAIYYDGDTVDCYYCYQIRPDSADVIIDLSINDDNPEVEITVFSGLPDESPVVSEFTADTTTVFVYVPMDAYYSVKAVYEYEGKTVEVLDGDMMEAKLVTEICDEDCWYIVGGEYDVKFRE